MSDNKVDIPEYKVVIDKQLIYGTKGNSMPLGIKDIQGSEPNPLDHINKIKELARQSNVFELADGSLLDMNYRDDVGFSCTDRFTKQVYFYNYDVVDLTRHSFYTLTKIS